MRCLHCGKRLSLLRKFSDGEFCSTDHRQLFQQQQSDLALARLIESQSRIQHPKPARPEREKPKAAKPKLPSADAVFPEAPPLPEWFTPVNQRVVFTAELVPQTPPRTTPWPEPDLRMALGEFPQPGTVEMIGAQPASASAIRQVEACSLHECPAPAGELVLAPAQGAELEVATIGMVALPKRAPVAAAVQTAAMGCEPLAPEEEIQTPVAGLSVERERTEPADGEPESLVLSLLPLVRAVGTQVQIELPGIQQPAAERPIAAAASPEYGSESLEPVLAGAQAVAKREFGLRSSKRMARVATRAARPRAMAAVVGVSQGPVESGWEPGTPRLQATGGECGWRSESGLEPVGTALAIVPRVVAYGAWPCGAEMEPDYPAARLELQAPEPPPECEQPACVVRMVEEPIHPIEDSEPAAPAAPLNQIPLQTSGGVAGAPAEPEVPTCTVRMAEEPTHPSEDNEPAAPAALLNQISLQTSRGVEAPPPIPRRSKEAQEPVWTDSASARPLHPTSRLTIDHADGSGAREAARTTTRKKKPSKFLLGGRHLPGHRFWRHAPADLKWVALGLPLLLLLVVYSIRGGASKQEAVGETGQATVAAQGKTVIGGQLNTLQKVIMSRAAVKLFDDFRGGLSAWEGPEGWSKTWRYGQASFLEPGMLALYTPTLGMRDYTMQFLGQIDKKSLNWVFRARDGKNYYAMRLVITKEGPLPSASMVRYAVVDGKEQDLKTLPIPFPVRSDTLYHVRMDVQGDSFVTYIQGSVVDHFEDKRFGEGGVGFFSPKGERSYLRWVEVTHQYDYIGRLCALLAPYHMQGEGKKTD
ncbi:MAG: hypothetical protein HZB13_01660 [Acidobacteria bacterium]|nr:hypothetical protein [Acidobacteriota bacterium]